MQERTLVFIKPDGVKRKLVGRVLTRFEEKGFNIVELKQLTLSSELADKHYQEHVKRDFYPSLKQFICSGPIVVMVLEGPKVIESVRRLVGETDSLQAVPGTIRGDFSVSKGENIIHASDSPESAEREISNFF